MTPLGIVDIVIFAFLLALDTVALGIRLRSRSLQGLSLCFNDYATLITLVCITISSSVILNHSGNDNQPLVTGLFVILVLGKFVHSLEQTCIVI